MKLSALYALIALGLWTYAMDQDYRENVKPHSRQDILTSNLENEALTIYRLRKMRPYIVADIKQDLEDLQEL